MTTRLFDEIAVAARRAKIRVVNDDPTLEWLASRMADGHQIDALAAPDVYGPTAEAFAAVPLVTVRESRYTKEGEVLFVERPPALTYSPMFPQRKGLE